MNVASQRNAHAFSSAPQQRGRASFNRYGSSYVRRNLLLDLPIASRLALGFILAALIAALSVGIVGIQRTQSLSKESDFYQKLLQINTSLTSGNSFLQSMDTKVHSMLNDGLSRETLNDDRTAINGLVRHYQDVLNGYVHADLLGQHPDQVALLQEGNHADLVGQQQTLVSSVIRTWQVYSKAQDQVLQDITAGNAAAAHDLERAQGEPTNADAISSLHSLIQFNGQLASSVQDAVSVEEQNQLLTTIIAVLCALSGVGLVGWLISDTLVRRLHQLQSVTQKVEAGHFDTRVMVAGRDEIAEVSLSVNGMLDTIVGLLEETRHQRDALSNAAEHLFSDMRIASAGDLRVNAPVSSDPIGMLANAFNFTIGRFRRFVLSAQTTAEQLDVISRQELEHAESFLHSVEKLLSEKSAVQTSPMAKATATYAVRLSTHPLPVKKEDEVVSYIDEGFNTKTANGMPVSGQLRGTTIEDHSVYLRHIIDTVEQAYLSLDKLNRITAALLETRSATVLAKLAQIQVQEVKILESQMKKALGGLRDIQKKSSETHGELASASSWLQTSISPVEPGASTGFALEGEEGEVRTRMAIAFAQEIVLLAQRLAEITKELRASIRVFQFDARDTPSSLP